ncbi:MAG: sulfatase [Rikenellaceae bacterium]
MKPTFFIGVAALTTLPLSELSAEQSRPNILLILSDDHSFPHVGAYGDENCKRFNLTPNMDALAKEGVLFNRAYTSASTSAPSRSSMFTGQSPLKVKALRFGQAVQPETNFFTDLLRESGYWVGLSGRGHHLSSISRTKNLAEIAVEAGMAGREFNSRFDLANSFPTNGKNYLKVEKHIGDILDSTPKEKPFFLYYGITQPHVPNPETYPDVDIRQMQMPDDMPKSAEYRVLYARYLQAVKECDNVLGQILDALKQRGLYEDTVIIFMGDNGEWLNSSAAPLVVRSKGTLYDRGTHVPLIVRYPEKSKRGLVSDALVSGVDICSFVLDVASVEQTPQMEGISFLPALSNKKYDQREYAFCAKGYHPSDAPNYSRSVNDGRFLMKYNMQYKPHRPTFELFDLQKDPFQYDNLFDNPAYKSTQEELLTQLDYWMVKCGDFMPPPCEAMAINAISSELK